MSRIVVSAERVVDAPAHEIYAILVNYRGGHREILPPNFVNYHVLEGGTGAGTVVSFAVRAGGRERPLTVRVSEPIPGSVLVETDINSSLATTFSMTPQDDGKRTLVNFRTEWQGSPGVGGFFERTFAPIALRRIYNQELDNLAALLSKRHLAASTPGS